MAKILDFDRWQERHSPDREVALMAWARRRFRELEAEQALSGDTSSEASQSLAPDRTSDLE